jgi:hypothetical protein
MAVPSKFFGLHIHQATGATPWPPFPVFAWRLWDSDVAWSHLQPSEDQWNFDVLDRYVELAEENDAEILLTLGHTPRWAASRPEEVSVSGALGAGSDPKDLRLWREYIQKVATRYEGRIHLYEIWNEPNMRGSYTGTISQMVALAREAYSVIKDVDSTNIVVSPSAAGGGTDLQWLEAFLSQGGGKYCDVIGYHFYVTPAPPEAMVNVIDDVKKLLVRYGIRKAIWNTESGWAGGRRFVDDEQRMGYLARAYILNWAAGVERFYWYAYDNYHWSTLPLTLPDHRTVTAAGKAYASLQSWLINSRIKSCSGSPDGAWRCELVSAKGVQAWILWSSKSASPSPVRVDCCKYGRIYHLDGRSELTDVATGLHVGTAPILVEGASP